MIRINQIKLPLGHDRQDLLPRYRKSLESRQGKLIRSI